MAALTDDNLLRVAIVGSHSGSMELLQRHIGGILKGIAKVNCCHINHVIGNEADLYLSFAHGEQLRKMKKRLQQSQKEIMGVELTLLPVAVRTLRTLPRNMVLGVVAEHQTCANYFFSEIVRAGVAEYRFLIGTFAEMKNMKVDRFIVAEEKRSTVEQFRLSQKIIYVARSVSPVSAAEIINTALEIATKE